MRKRWRSRELRRGWSRRGRWCRRRRGILRGRLTLRCWLGGLRRSRGFFRSVRPTEIDGGAGTYVDQAFAFVGNFHSPNDVGNNGEYNFALLPVFVLLTK